MPKMNIKRSITIDRPVEEIYSKLNDFNHWHAWSPWLIMDPKAKVEVEEGGKSYGWEGSRVGSGKMSVTNEKENELIEYDLNFLKPWKSFANVRFQFDTKDNSTEVSWYMDSKLPWFMFWMKKQMEAFVGSDYERGLFMLKDYTEHDQVHSKLDFLGESNFEGCTFIGIRTKATKDTVGAQMASDFGKIWKYLEGNKDIIAGDGFSIYHKWDMVSGKVEYTSGVPVKNIPDDLPSDFISDSIPSIKIYTLRHTGPYLHLGNAWSTMYNIQRAKEFKVNKKIHPFEFYRNAPGQVPDKELITEVNFAIK